MERWICALYLESMADSVTLHKERRSLGLTVPAQSTSLAGSEVVALELPNVGIPSRFVRMSAIHPKFGPLF